MYEIGYYREIRNALTRKQVLGLKVPTHVIAAGCLISLSSIDSGIKIHNHRIIPEISWPHPDFFKKKKRSYILFRNIWIL